MNHRKGDALFLLLVSLPMITEPCIGSSNYHGLQRWCHNYAFTTVLQYPGVDTFVDIQQLFVQHRMSNDVKTED